MELTLMCQDDEVAAFELDLATGRVTNVQPLAHAAQAPLSVRFAGPDPADDLARFVARRALSPWRADLTHILSATHASSTLELALQAHGLSLSDPYWYRAKDDRGTWASLNFFENDWDPAFGAAVLARDGEALATASCLVPDATRLGMLASQVANGTTDLRMRAMWDEPQPFFEYWGGRVWSEELDLDDLDEPELVSAVV